MHLQVVFLEAVMDIFGGIDGTGPFRDTTYNTEFATSFVSKLEREFIARGSRAIRLRGPSVSGYETTGLAEKLSARLIQDVGCVDAPRVFLAGYSRGGLAVLRVCERLRQRNIRVHCLLLFDAVDMALGIDVPTVPDNVDVCFHAKRNSDTLSRPNWGNCGNGAKSARYYEESFYCTHGGMGGLPWNKADSDGIINEADEDIDAIASFLQSTPPVGPFAAFQMAGIANTIYKMNSRTNVKIAEDREGSAKVWKWMQDGLKQRLAAPGSREYALAS